MQVKSSVIDWVDKTLEVTTPAGEKHITPLATPITVTMIGYPDKETVSLLAGELAEYMTRGYIILEISW